jgi:hypothetical protein
VLKEAAVSAAQQKHKTPPGDKVFDARMKGADGSRSIVCTAVRQGVGSAAEDPSVSLP